MSVETKLGIVLHRVWAKDAAEYWERAAAAQERGDHEESRLLRASAVKADKTAREALENPWPHAALLAAVFLLMGCVLAFLMLLLGPS